MSSSRYPAYKDSGVPWLGQVPAHWDVVQIRHLALLEGGSTPTEAEILSGSDEGHAWATPADMEGWHSELSSTSRRITDVGLASIGGFIAQPGQILFSCRAPVGKVAVIKTAMAFNQGCKAIIPKPGVHSRFLAWQLDAARATFDLAARGTTFAEVSAGAIRAVFLSRPPGSEQQIIADFLDRETAKLDSLADEQTALLGLLAEKRQAVISRAVTKGFTPTAPMKDSGVEWMGRVPAHWQVVPIRGLARPGRNTFIDGDWIEAPYITSEGVRLLQTGNVGTGNFKEQGYRYVSEETFDELGCTEVSPGDLLICRLAAPVGRACVAPDLGVRMITSVDVAILKPDEATNPRYYAALFSSAQYLGFMEGECRGGTRDRISRSFLGALRVVQPPRDEQDAIVAVLAARIDQLDGLAAEARNSIALLRERRAALISAVVTGRIDVRESASASRGELAAA